jgi:aryl-alcohol dehydrogenase-like predicted oxidoreductase
MAILSDYHCRNCPSYHRYVLIRIHRHTKALKHSLEASLKKLKTDYIDILYIHWWDYSTSIPELMHALDDHVKSGKVLYLGISDTPAW